MFRPGSDGTAERSFQIRNYEDMVETLQQIAGAEKTVFTMRALKVSHHVDVVYWAQIHWAPEFKWSITYHKTHFDMLPMGFWKRYQYRALSMYGETPASIADLAEGIAEDARKRRNGGSHEE